MNRSDVLPPEALAALQSFHEAFAARDPAPALLGPTAAGKTALLLAARAATGLPLVVVSADAFQIYRGLDLGTAKPNPEDRARLPHLLLDQLEPTESYSAGRFMQEAGAAIDEIIHRGQYPVVAGGTGLYVWALARGLHSAPPPDAEIRGLPREEVLQRLREKDPAAAGTLAAAPLPRLVRALEITTGSGLTLAAWQASPRSPGRALRIFLLAGDRAELYARIEARVDRMLAQGLIDEVERLRAAGITAGHPSQRAIGYREVHEYLEGRIDRARLAELLKRNTRRLAKRQMTWNRHHFPEATVLPFWW